MHSPRLLAAVVIITHVMIYMIAPCSSFSVASDGCTPSDSSYDYLLLALQWPRGFVSSSSSAREAYISHWTIHGLWPSRSKTQGEAETYPCFCSREKMRLDEFAPALLARMERYWPSLSVFNNTNAGFWEHEWDKHGTCCSLSPRKSPLRTPSTTTTPADQITYFTRTLDLRDGNDPMSSLSRSGILPDDERPLTADEVVAGLGPTAMIGCRSPKRHSSTTDGYQILSEIGMCFSRRTLKRVPCPETVRLVRDEVNDCRGAVPIIFPKPQRETSTLGEETAVK